jgi:hypothetical protein
MMARRANERAACRWRQLVHELPHEEQDNCHRTGENHFLIIRHLGEADASVNSTKARLPPRGHQPERTGVSGAGAAPHGASGLDTCRRMR